MKTNQLYLDKKEKNKERYLELIKQVRTKRPCNVAGIDIITKSISVLRAQCMLDIPCTYSRLADVNTIIFATYNAGNSSVYRRLIKRLVVGKYATDFITLNALAKESNVVWRDFPIGSVRETATKRQLEWIKKYVNLTPRMDDVVNEKLNN